MLQSFISELERNLGLQTPLRQETDGVWLLPIEADKDVMILDRGEGYSFQCLVGPCPEKNVEEFFMKILRANLFGKGTEGAVVGLDGEGKEVMVALDRNNKEDYRLFQADLEVFLSAVDYWKQALNV